LKQLDTQLLRQFADEVSMSTDLLNPVQGTTRVVAGKYLTFRLGNESYGVTVLKVREIIRLQALTLVPQMPEYIKGVVNLRGKIVPVIDLRLKFGLEDIRDGEQTCIVVVQITTSSQSAVTMGVIVDGVEEVIQISTTDVEPAPDFGTQVDTQYILGMAKIKGVVKILLDIDQVVSAETIERAGQLSQKAQGF